MHPLVAEFAPSEGRSSELEIIRGEQRPLHVATGFVIGGTVSSLFWGLLGVAIWLALR
jgi:hypothetical protein